jgi:hypothetical protein
MLFDDPSTPRGSDKKAQQHNSKNKKRLDRQYGSSESFNNRQYDYYSDSFDSERSHSFDSPRPSHHHQKYRHHSNDSRRHEQHESRRHNRSVDSFDRYSDEYRRNNKNENFGKRVDSFDSARRSTSRDDRIYHESSVDYFDRRDTYNNNKHNNNNNMRRGDPKYDEDSFDGFGKRDDRRKNDDELVVQYRKEPSKSSAKSNQKYNDNYQNQKDRSLDRNVDGYNQKGKFDSYAYDDDYEWRNSQQKRYEPPSRSRWSTRAQV